MPQVSKAANIPPGLNPLKETEISLLQQVQDCSHKVSKCALMAYFQKIGSFIEGLFSKNDIEKLGGGEHPIRAQDLVRYYETLCAEHAEDLQHESQYCQEHEKPYSDLKLALEARLEKLRQHLTTKINGPNPKPYELNALMRVNTALKIDNAVGPIIANKQNKDPKSHSEASIVDFREEGLTELIFKKTETDNDHTKQIENDAPRYELKNKGAILQAIRAENVPAIRQNMFFACSQKFEITLARYMTRSYGLGEQFSVIQNSVPSKMVCDVNARQTTLTSQFRVMDFSTRKEGQLVEIIEVKAIFNWNSGEAYIFKRKIS